MKRSSVCFPNKAPRDRLGNVEIGALIQQRGWAGQELRSALETALGQGMAWVTVIATPCIWIGSFTFISFITFYSHNQPKEKAWHLHCRKEALKVKCFCQTRRWGPAGTGRKAEFRTPACTTLPPTGRSEKCSFRSWPFWHGDLIFKSLDSVRLVQRDGQPRSQPGLWKAQALPGVAEGKTRVLQNERRRIKNGKEGEKQKRSGGRLLTRECVFTSAPPLMKNAELASAVRMTRTLSVPGLEFKHQDGETREEAGGMIAPAVTLSLEDPRLGKCLMSRTPPFFEILRAKLGFREICRYFCGLLVQRSSNLSLHHSLLEGLLQQPGGTPLRAPEPVGLGRAKGCAFLASSQVLLLLLPPPSTQRPWRPLFPFNPFMWENIRGGPREGKWPCLQWWDQWGADSGLKLC